MSKKNKKINMNELKNKVNIFLEDIYTKQFDERDVFVRSISSSFSYSSILLNDIIKEIMMDEHYSKLFSAESLSTYIFNIVSDGIRSKENNQKIFENIIEYIKNDPKEFVCVIPIHGISITEKYDMGVVKLYPSEQREEVIQSIYKEKSQRFIKNSFKSKSNFATIKVIALQSQKAVEIAVSEVNKSLNIIKILFCDLNNIYQIGVGKKGESMFDKEFLAVSDDQTDGVVTHPFKYTPLPAEINEITDAGNKVVKILADIQKRKFRNEKTIPLENHLFNSLNLIATGLYENDYETKSSKFMSAIESLVEQKTFTQGITDQVCERTALLLGNDFDERKQIYYKMFDLYNQRSTISHGDESNVDIYDTEDLWIISKRLLFYLLSNFDKFVDSNNKPKIKIKDYVMNLRFK